MLIVRLIAAMAVGAAAALGVQYALSGVFGGPAPADGDRAASYDAPAEPQTDDEDDPIPEDRILLPYDGGQAAPWLAETLAGTGPYMVAGRAEGADLAALAAEAAGPGGAGRQVTADCGASHVMVHCVLRVAGDDATQGYAFGMWDDGVTGWVVAPGSVDPL